MLPTLGTGQQHLAREPSYGKSRPFGVGSSRAAKQTVKPPRPREIIMESSRPLRPIVPCQMLPICQMLVATLPRNSFQPHNSRTHGRERHQTGGGGEKTQGTSARTVPHTHLAKTTSPTTPATRARHAQTRVQTPSRQTGAVAKITSKHAGTPRESTGRGPRGPAPPHSTTTH